MWIRYLLLSLFLAFSISIPAHSEENISDDNASDTSARHVVPENLEGDNCIDQCVKDGEDFLACRDECVIVTDRSSSFSGHWACR